jgi:hypothetical protein
MPGLYLKERHLHPLVNADIEPEDVGVRDNVTLVFEISDMP